MKEAEDVIEAGSELDAQDSALGAMLVVLGIGKDVQLQDGQALARHPQDVLVGGKRGSVSARV